MNYFQYQVIKPPPLAVGAGNVDVDEEDDDVADIENNAGEDIDKVVAAVDGEDEDGEYVGDDEDGGQGGRRLPNQTTYFKSQQTRVNLPSIRGLQYQLLVNAISY